MAPRKAAKSNGVAKYGANSSSARLASASSQLTDLYEQDKERLKEWLDSNEKPFGVTIDAPTRKRKRGEEMYLEGGLLAEGLNVVYTVKPRDKWESLRRFKKFTVGPESIATGQCILVKHDQSSDDIELEPENQWKAQVLEVRALDSEHVYIRVAWLNRPEDLACGRQPHHGKHELIVTNEMDIIDAMSVNGTFEVMQLDEKDDNCAAIEGHYFWRQTYDLVTKKFSELRKICKDRTPANPDEVIIQCSNETCREWLHVQCLAEDALQEHESAVKKGKKNKRPKDEGNEKAGVTPVAYTHSKKRTAKVEVYVKGASTDPSDTPATRSEIVVVSKGGKLHAQDLVCLKCDEPLDENGT